MSGLSDTRNQNRFHGIKLEWSSLLPIKSVVHENREEDNPTYKLLSEGEIIPPCNRLVVVLPDSGFDIPAIHKRIWKLAAPDHRQVLLLNQPNSQGNEYRSRSNLTTLAARIRDWRVVVQTQMVLGMSLEQAVKQCTKPGDVIICFEEHFMPGFFRKTRLAEKLASTITLPVYTLSGKVTEKSDLFSARLLDYGLLVFCLVSLIGFFAFEVWVDQNSIGAIRTILQIMAIFVEVWIVAACSKRFY